jgi:murein DD-endopeptidase MepM/ murein hydrolase activator NlpD
MKRKVIHRVITITLVFLMVWMVFSSLAVHKGGIINANASYPKFSLNDVVGVNNVGDAGLILRSDPGTSSTILKKVPDGWAFRIISGSPVSKDGYNWWKVREEKYETYPVEGWVAENYIVKVSPQNLVPPSSPDYFVSNPSKIEEAIAWALAQKDKTDWSGYCLRFVREAFKGEPIPGWDTAENARRMLEAKGKFYSWVNCWNPPRGALIFFSTTGPYAGQGHVGIYLGDQKVVHAYGKVRVDEVEDGKKGGIVIVEKLTYIDSYIGWAYPPEEWMISPTYPKPTISVSDNENVINVDEIDWVKFTVKNEGTEYTSSWGIQVKVGDGLELVQHSSYPWNQKVCNDKAAEWYKFNRLNPGDSDYILVGIKGKRASNYESVWYTAWMYDPDGKPQPIQYAHPVRNVPCDRDYAEYGVIVQPPSPPPNQPKFLTLPFRDSEVKIQQGWIYTWNPNATHKGIDYRKGEVDKPDTWKSFDVVAAADGWAMWSEQPGDTGVYGKFVLIRHEEKDPQGKDYFTLYAHLQSVSAGIPYQDRHNIDYNYNDASKWKYVKRGEVIGRAGNTGALNTGIHLHFEVQRGGYGLDKTDPYDLYKTRDFYPGGNNYISSGPNYLWTTDPPTLPTVTTQTITIPIVATQTITVTTVSTVTTTTNVALTYTTTTSVIVIDGMSTATTATITTITTTLFTTRLTTVYSPTYTITESLTATGLIIPEFSTSQTFLGVTLTISLCILGLLFLSSRKRTSSSYRKITKNFRGGEKD